MNVRHIGEAIRFARQSLNLQQSDLADRSGMSRSHISQIEMGNREPSWEMLRKIAKGMGMDVSMLTMLTESDSPNVKPLIPFVYSHLWERRGENV